MHVSTNMKRSSLPAVFLLSLHNSSFHFFTPAFPLHSQPLFTSPHSFTFSFLTLFLLIRTLLRFFQTLAPF